MPYESDKSPAQLLLENKTKSAAELNKMSAKLSRLSRKRHIPPTIKKHMEEVAEDMRAMAKAVGPEGSTP